tara:strand:- start:508 stop:669 length:162 start_codon:yes stop_codon:yes gene_type:complete
MLENNNEEPHNTSTKSEKEYEKSIQLVITNKMGAMIFYKLPIVSYAHNSVIIS